jgi:glutamate-1-semialdehyde 2,1-aminomutase
MGSYDNIKFEVLNCAQRLTHRGLFTGTGGNISMRIPGEDRLAVTPSGMDYLAMKPLDICICDFSGALIDGGFKPSIETGMHISVMKSRPDVNAIIHTHQVQASTFAVLDTPIPSLFDEQVFNLGPVVDIIPYGMSGSVDLLNNVTAGVASRCNAYILKNHGVLLLGISMEETERNVSLLEKTAQVYLGALSTGKDISLLDKGIADFLFIMLKDKQDKEIARKKSA